MIFKCLGAVLALASCVLGAPCQVIVLHDPGQIISKEAPATPQKMREILADVITHGGRVRSVAQIELPLSTDDPFISVASKGSQATVVLGNDGTSWLDPLAHVQPERLYSKKSPAYDGIGKMYMGREISEVMGHLGAGWLERPEREQEERTDLLVELMDVEPDDVIADIGSGTGYFSLRLAPRVPDGKVVAVDIQPEMNEILERNAGEQGIKNVETVLGEIDDAKIPANTIDIVLFVDAYHEFSHPWEMKRSLIEALKPGGRIVLVEYRAEDPSVRIKPRHKMSESQARREFEAAGFRWITTHDDLPQQHVLIFQKPGGQVAGN